MTVDECEALGLTVNKFTPDILQEFQQLKDQNQILKISATSNPVDLTGSVTDDQFVISADVIFRDPEINGIILLGLHHMPGLREKYIDGIVMIAAKIQQTHRNVRYWRNRNGALHPLKVRQTKRSSILFA